MTDITDAIKQALEASNPGKTVQVTAEQPATPAAVVVPPHVADNICKLLERVETKGIEAIAWVEAFQLMQRIRGAGPGVPFAGLGK